MGHYSQNQYGQNEQSPEPSGSHHYRIHEVDTHTRLLLDCSPFWIDVMRSCSHRLPNSKGSAVIQWKKRMYQPTRGRLKRENFVHQSRCLEQRHRDILEQKPRKISQCLEIPAWSKERYFLIKSGVPGIGPKDSQNDLMRKLITLDHLQLCHPKETWTYIFTDGSA